MIAHDQGASSVRGRTGHDGVVQALLRVGLHGWSYVGAPRTHVMLRSLSVRRIRSVRHSTCLLNQRTGGLPMQLPPTEQSLEGALVMVTSSLAGALGSAPNGERQRASDKGTPAWPTCWDARGTSVSTWIGRTRWTEKVFSKRFAKIIIF